MPWSGAACQKVAAASCAASRAGSGATDMQVANQMGHSKIETTKNLCGHLFAQDRAFILKAMNQAMTRLDVQDDGVDAQAALQGFPE